MTIRVQQPHQREALRMGAPLSQVINKPVNKCGWGVFDGAPARREAWFPTKREAVRKAAEWEAEGAS